MKIEITTNTAIRGKSVSVGDKPECSESDAKYLIDVGFAKLATETKEKPAPKAKAKK